MIVSKLLNYAEWSCLFWHIRPEGLCELIHMISSHRNILVNYGDCNGLGNHKTSTYHYKGAYYYFIELLLHGDAPSGCSSEGRASASMVNWQRVFNFLKPFWITSIDMYSAQAHFLKFKSSSISRREISTTYLSCNRSGFCWMSFCIEKVAPSHRASPQPSAGRRIMLLVMRSCEQIH